MIFLRPAFFYIWKQGKTSLRLYKLPSRWANLRLVSSIPLKKKEGFNFMAWLTFLRLSEFPDTKDWRLFIRLEPISCKRKQTDRQKTYASDCRDTLPLPSYLHIFISGYRSTRPRIYNSLNEWYYTRRSALSRVLTVCSLARLHSVPLQQETIYLFDPGIRYALHRIYSLYYGTSE